MEQVVQVTHDVSASGEWFSGRRTHRTMCRLNSFILTIWWSKNGKLFRTDANGNLSRPVSRTLTWSKSFNRFAKLNRYCYIVLKTAGFAGERDLSQGGWTMRSIILLFLADLINDQLDLRWIFDELNQYMARQSFIDLIYVRSFFFPFYKFGFW